MVCPRCISAVEKTIVDLGVKPVLVQLGEVILEDVLDEHQTETLKIKLQAQGFELLDDSKKQIIEKIKAIVIEYVHHSESNKFQFPELISKALNKEYSQLSKLFSVTEGVTIEQYVILQKIEKVKELLIYDQLSLSEIAYKMGYSSVAHLSSQFKKTIGLTPSQFKSQGISMRKGLDTL